MAVYRIEVKKRAQRHGWSNAYVVLTAAAYRSDELAQIADTVAPRFVAFERHFHSEEVEITETVTLPLLEPPATEIAYRPAELHGRAGRSVTGLRPIAIEESAGPSLTLMLGLQPVSRHWGWKDYRYALHQGEIQASTGGYHLRPESLANWQQTLATAKRHLQPLLLADSTMPSFAVSATRNTHDPHEYQQRYVCDLLIKGVHINKHRR